MVPLLTEGSSSSMMQNSRRKATDGGDSPEETPIRADLSLAAGQGKLLTAPHALHQVVLHL